MDIADKLARSLGLSGSGNLFHGWPCHMRMNKYSFTPDNVSNCGLPIHMDGTFLSLLQDNDVVGRLEFVNNRFGSLVAVEPCPNTLFVNIGDLAVVGKTIPLI